MRDRAPLVSVCIPTRDRAHWLGEALESVFAQTLRDFEVIVYDDASEDATDEVLRAWQEPRLRTFRHSTPVGVAANRNACLDVARGDYVAWLDSDDRYHPHMLEVQVARLEAQPGVAMVHGASDIIDEYGDPLPDWPASFDGDVVEPGADAFQELVLENYVAAPTVVVRRRAHDLAGPYRASLHTGEDWEMWLRLALHGDVAYTARRVAQYRWHEDSLSRSIEASGLHLERDSRILAELFAELAERIPDIDAVSRRANAALAVRGLRRATDLVLAGRRLGALRCLLRLGQACPELARDARAWRLLPTATLEDDYRWHVESRECLRALLPILDGSRLAESLRDCIDPSSEWEATLEQIARTVREVIPQGDAVAVVDKWDPTLLHLSQRRGWHFPDLGSMPDGYPPDSHTAITHLEELRRRGARHLIFPCSAFWWLDCYEGLVSYLEACGERTWQDDRCVIYKLDRGDSCAA